MKGSAVTLRGALDRRVAVVLYVGTWLASAVVAIGLLLPSGASIVMTGIALFIALPIVRANVMVFACLRRRDYRIAVIPALVLAIIFLGIALSMRADAAGGAVRPVSCKARRWRR